MKGGSEAVDDKPDDKPTRDEKGRFLTGNKGGGRARGSRNKLGEEFLDALFADFQEHGAGVIAQVREKKPDAYLKVVASLLPREIRVADTMDDLSDEQLAQRIRELDAVITEIDPNWKRQIQ